MVGAKVEQVCAEYYSSNKDLTEPYEELLKRVLSLLQEFPNAPFTVQRLCELLLDPHRIYATSTRKVTSALEKLLTVSSTVPTMVVAQPKPGTYQAASETQLSPSVLRVFTSSLAVFASPAQRSSSSLIGAMSL